MVLGRHATTFGTRRVHVPATKALHAPEWPCSGRAPAGAPSGRKITNNGPRCLREGPQKVPLSKLMDKLNLGTVWVAFWPCLDPCGFIWAPNVSQRAETEKWPYLGLDKPNRESVDTFPRANPHFRWFPPLSLSLRLSFGCTCSIECAHRSF